MTMKAIVQVENEMRSSMMKINYRDPLFVDVFSSDDVEHLRAHVLRLMGSFEAEYTAEKKRSGEEDSVFSPAALEAVQEMGMMIAARRMWEAKKGEE